MICAVSALCLASRPCLARRNRALAPVGTDPSRRRPGRTGDVLGRLGTAAPCAYSVCLLSLGDGDLARRRSGLRARAATQRSQRNRTRDRGSRVLVCNAGHGRALGGRSEQCYREEAQSPSTVRGGASSGGGEGSSSKPVLACSFRELGRRSDLVPRYRSATVKADATTLELHRDTSLSTVRGTATIQPEDIVTAALVEHLVPADVPRQDCPRRSPEQARDRQVEKVLKHLLPLSANPQTSR